MTDRDGLIKLIDGFVFGTQIPVNNIEWDSTKVKELSDYLIKNGVILPPCKVGDTIYQIDGLSIYSGTIHEITYTSNKVIYVTENFVFDDTAIGTGILLTKEEAEKELERRKENA